MYVQGNGGLDVFTLICSNIIMKLLNSLMHVLLLFLVREKQKYFAEMCSKHQHSMHSLTKTRTIAKNRLWHKFKYETVKLYWTFFREISKINRSNEILEKNLVHSRRFCI